MTNYEFQQRLAADIATDGFDRHAKLAANFVGMLSHEGHFTQTGEIPLVEIVRDASLADVVRARAFGLLRLATKGQTKLCLENTEAATPLLAV